MEARWLLTFALVLAGCERRSAPACPPEAVVAQLHDAAFWLERDDLTRGTALLSDARAALPAPVEPTAAALLEGLSAAAALPAAEGAARTQRTEAARAQLSSWACLTPELHDRLHRALPPIPHQ